MRILITGGAGYIGSHCAKTLLDQGHVVTIFDNLSTGCKRMIDPRSRFINASTQNHEVLSQVLRTFEIDSVIHFAGSSQAHESLADPSKYYQNNLQGLMSLLLAMRNSNIKKLIFSSSAAVYGEPEADMINELHPKKPLHPYGKSLSMCEDIISDFSHSYGMNYTILRYFNIAGIHPEMPCEEDISTDCPHLIPRALRACAGLAPDLEVFGKDYPTLDGTCIRDYLHVCDLSEAYMAALNLAERIPNQIYNVGSAQGSSVYQVVRTCQELTGSKIKLRVGARRLGDLASFVSDNHKITTQLEWRPRFQSLSEIIKTNWEFQLRQIQEAKNKPTKINRFKSEPTNLNLGSQF